MTRIAPRRKKFASKVKGRKEIGQPAKFKMAERKPTARKASIPSARGRPAAAVGRALEARDIMTSDVLTASPHTPLREVAKLMLSRHISALPVVDDSGRLVGIVSEGDLYRRAEIGTGRQRSWWLELFSSEDSGTRNYLKEHGHRAEDVMTRRVISVKETSLVTDIAETLGLHRIKRVPVMRGDQLVGIVSRADLVRAMLHTYELDKTSKSDGAIRAAFEKALKAESWVGDWYVNFSVKKGVVKIVGRVGSDEQVRALRSMAEGIRGVKEVDSSHLTWE